jgi:diguanylate cyclase (GGDEF)-like protein
MDGDVDTKRTVGDDHIGSVLAGAIRLVRGAVVACFVPQHAADSPVIWSSLEHAELGTALSTLVAQRLADGGPWGECRGGGPEGEWSAWVEPVPWNEDEVRTDTEDVAGSPRKPAGAVAVARPGRHRPFTTDEHETLRLFARLCAGATHGTRTTGQRAYQRRLDDLVSQISERLMSTTLPTMRVDLEWTVETLCRFLEADFAFLRRNDHAAGMSVLMAEYPRREVDPSDDPLGAVPFDSDPIFAATRDLKVPLIIQNLTNDEEAYDERYTERVKEGSGAEGFAGAGVPLVHAGVTEGCLGFVYLSDIDWSEHEINALRAVAALLVQLIYRVDAEERLRHNALTDDLTGLANRRSLLSEVSARVRSRTQPLALLFIDLDRFKVMNDHLGHRAGDRVLQVIGDRIRTSLRPTDFAARLGGDEFVVLLDDSGGVLGAAAAANRLLEVISRPIDVGGQLVAHSGSVGIAVCDDDTMSGEDLLGQADIALYEAKSQGRNQTVVFDHHLESNVAQRSSIELLLRKALADNAFRVLYQPEFDLETGRMLAVEALVRWEREGHGLVAACDFVPVAEETHLILDIDRWVLDEACMQLARWRRAYPGLDLDMRVNISAAQFAVSGIVQAVADSLRRSGVPPERLCLEITEQAMIANVEEAVRLLDDVRTMGVQLAIDDFGTGYSSMMQLKSLPVDVLKIDRAFVEGIATDATDRTIVDTIIRLADAFRLEVVAEGVERPEDLRTLIELGCRRAQGYLLSRPITAAAVEPLFAGIDLAAFGVPVSAAG